MAKIDASKSAFDNLLVLVNAANAGQTLTNAQVTAGTPSVKTDSGDGRNTTVTLTAVAASGYSGSVNVNYKRRGLNDSVLNPVDAYSVDDGVTKAQIIAGVAAALGLVVSELDLTGSITRPSGSDTSTVTLTSNTGSLLYIDGSTQTITLNWAHHDTPLNSAVTTTDLNGFDAAS